MRHEGYCFTLLLHSLLPPKPLPTPPPLLLLLLLLLLPPPVHAC
jgi:hypothetical protein